MHYIRVFVYFCLLPCVMLQAWIVNAPVASEEQIRRFGFVGHLNGAGASGTGYNVGCREVVLTALHVARHWKKRGFNFTPALGDDAIEIDEVRVPKKAPADFMLDMTKRESVNLDIALLKLASPVPDTVTLDEETYPRPLAKLSEKALRKQTPVQLMGFGKGDYGPATNLAFRVTEAKFLGTGDEFDTGRTVASPRSILKDFLAVLPNATRALATKGDSGGPLVRTFPGDIVRVYGVLSMQDIHPRGNMHRNYFNPVYRHRGWLRKNIRELCGKPDLRVFFPEPKKPSLEKEWRIADWAPAVDSAGNTHQRLHFDRARFLCQNIGYRLPSKFEIPYVKRLFQEFVVKTEKIFGVPNSIWTNTKAGKHKRVVYNLSRKDDKWRWKETKSRTKETVKHNFVCVR